LEERLRLSLTLLALDNNAGVSKRGFAPLFKIIPFPLMRGRGYRG